jgi:hypothetical protein
LPPGPDERTSDAIPRSCRMGAVPGNATRRIRRVPRRRARTGDIGASGRRIP